MVNLDLHKKDEVKFERVQFPYSVKNNSGLLIIFLNVSIHSNDWVTKRSKISLPPDIFYIKYNDKHKKAINFSNKKEFYLQ